MSKQIVFEKLTLKDALDLAILVEEEAQERYEEFVHQMEIHHTKEAAVFFQEMAENETKHREELQQRRWILFQDQPTEVDRSMLWDVEAPDYDQVRAFISVRQAMSVALQSEIKAHDFFQAAMKHIDNREVLELFEDLRKEELDHQDKVRRALQRLPDTPDVDPDDYVDGPVAQ